MVEFPGEENDNVELQNVFIPLSRCCSPLEQRRCLLAVLRHSEAIEDNSIVIRLSPLMTVLCGVSLSASVKKGYAISSNVKSRSETSQGVEE